jgi:hypothetical protein
VRKLYESWLANGKTFRVPERETPDETRAELRIVHMSDRKRTPERVASNTTASRRLAEKIRFSAT